MSKVGDVLNKLYGGQIDAAEAGKQIAAVRSKPKVKPAKNFEELANREEHGTPGSIEPNSFDEVSAAYHLGKIDEEQYGQIVDAIAPAKDPKDQPGAPPAEQ